MKLSEFINQRLAELGMKRSDLVNKFDLEWSTLSAIDHDKTVRKITQEKLAKALHCTMGDIQQCLAEQNPLKDVVVSKKSLAKKQPSVMETVDKLEKMIKEEPYVTPEPEEEPENIFNSDPDPETSLDDYLNTPFPEYKSVYEEDRKEGEERYKQKLRDMCLRIFASGVPGVHTMEKIYADIGYALVKELAGGAE